ncbi:hypothetical protein ACF0H5_013230 [Mactra antiquata]
MSTVKYLRLLAKQRVLKGYSRPLLDEPIPEMNVPVLQLTVVRTTVEKANNLVKKSADTVSDWISWLATKTLPVVSKIPEKFKALKDKVA